jgi:multidrug efflux pump subunit AcrA (membrane-fusion protein)
MSSRSKTKILLAASVIASAVLLVWAIFPSSPAPDLHNSHNSQSLTQIQAQEQQTFYTCPMHPMIIQEEPGSCPICGMVLVPKDVGPASSENPQPDHDHSAAEPQTDGKSRAGQQSVYICPMHPSIVQNEPGTCPICGMDLVQKDLGGVAETPPPTTAGERKIKYWAAPMDPTYIRDEPGKSPMGMDLVPVYEENTGNDSGVGRISIDPVMVMNMGVRVAQVTRGPLVRSVRTLGEVDVAESEISVVNLRFSGWVEKIWADRTGDKVNRGDKLFAIYSPQLVAAQEEYLLAVAAGGRDSDLALSAAQRLLFWDIPQWFLDDIVARGNARRSFVVTALRSGYILHKNVVLGARVGAGNDLYRIGNLQTIWVNAEVYQFDAPWIEVGRKAKMQLSFMEGKTYEGQVGYIYPTLNPISKTLTVRLEFPNPGLNLKPGMFVTLWIEAKQRDNAIIVPDEAILHSGERRLVFVTDQIGKYTAREIVTGLSGDNHRTEVLSGLDEGETVVVSGQFMLDSESRLQEAIQKMLRSRLQAKNSSTDPAEVAPEMDPGVHVH